MKKTEDDPLVKGYGIIVRKSIVNSAREIFSVDGFTGIDHNRIVENAGYSRKNKGRYMDDVPTDNLALAKLAFDDMLVDSWDFGVKAWEDEKAYGAAAKDGGARQFADLDYAYTEELKKWYTEGDKHYRFIQDAMIHHPSEVSHFQGFHSRYLGWSSGNTEHAGFINCRDYSTTLYKNLFGSVWLATTVDDLTLEWLEEEVKKLRDKFFMDWCIVRGSVPPIDLFWAFNDTKHYRQEDMIKRWEEMTGPVAEKLAELRRSGEYEERRKLL